MEVGFLMIGSFKAPERARILRFQNIHFPQQTYLIPHCYVLGCDNVPRYWHSILDLTCWASYVVINEWTSAVQIRASNSVKYTSTKHGAKTPNRCKKLRVNIRKMRSKNKKKILLTRFLPALIVKVIYKLRWQGEACKNYTQGIKSCKTTTVQLTNALFHFMLILQKSLLFCRTAFKYYISVVLWLEGNLTFHKI